jgi:hypothetical protein
MQESLTASIIAIALLIPAIMVIDLVATVLKCWLNSKVEIVSIDYFPEIPFVKESNNNFEPIPDFWLLPVESIPHSSEKAEEKYASFLLPPAKQTETPELGLTILPTMNLASQADFSKMTLTQLKAEAKRRGIKTTAYNAKNKHILAEKLSYKI